MTALASGVEACSLEIAPRADGGFTLSDPLSGARVEARRLRDGRIEVGGEGAPPRLYCDAIAAIVAEMRRAGAGAAAVRPEHVAIALDVAEVEVLAPRGRAAVV